MYELGYCFSRYDLVVTAVRNERATVLALLKLRVSVVEASYEHGQVWRIRRDLSERELRTALGKLPCVFGPISLYVEYQVLEEARASEAFSFEALEYRPVH